MIFHKLSSAEGVVFNSLNYFVTKLLEIYVAMVCKQETAGKGHASHKNANASEMHCVRPSREAIPAMTTADRYRMATADRTNASRVDHDATREAEGHSQDTLTHTSYRDTL